MVTWVMGDSCCGTKAAGKDLGEIARPQGSTFDRYGRGASENHLRENLGGRKTARG